MFEKLKDLAGLHSKILGINQRNLEYIYPGSPRKYYCLADNKVKTKSILEYNGIPAPETYGVLETMGHLKAQWNDIAQRDELVIKPAMGKAGDGILVLEKNNDGNWMKASGNMISTNQIHQHIANILFGVYSFGSRDSALAEYRVHNHQLLNAIYSKGVPDLRIIVHRKKILMGMLRIPTNRSDGRANLHQGALGVAIEMESGRIGKAFSKGRHITSHPDTGEEFYGKILPDWERILEITEKTYDAFPFEYLGIDIVIDAHTGPLVMEINLRPGLEIQNINNKGLLETIGERLQ